MESKLLPSGKCPYCGKDQTLNYPGIKPLDNVMFITKLEEPVITDSFHEVETKSTCISCGKVFHFIHDIGESLGSRRHNDMGHLDSN